MAIKDPSFWLTSRKDDGRCAECESDIREGDRMVWDPATYKAYCKNCGEEAIGNDPLEDTSKSEDVRKHVSSRAASRSKTTNKAKTQKRKA